MNETTRNQLEQLRGTANGEALIVWLSEEITKMKDSFQIKTLEELQAKQEAGRILEKLFGFLDVKKQVVNKTKYN